MQIVKRLVRLARLELGHKLPTSPWCVLENDDHSQTNGNAKVTSMLNHPVGGKRVNPWPRRLARTS